MTRTLAEGITAAPAHTVRRGMGLQRFVAGWAALGIILSGATQLRMAGLPVGPSELILVLWILFVTFLLLRGMPFTLDRVFYPLVGYWLLALALLGFGAIVAMQARKVSVFAAHDAMSHLYLALLTSLLSLSLGDRGPGDYHLCLARRYFLFSAVCAGLLLAIANVTPALGPIGFWFGPRLRGWAANPNQLALPMVAMPFLGWWLLRQIPGRLRKTAYALGIAVCIATGIATQSDGLRVSWAAGFGAVGALAFYRVTLRGRSRWLHISHVAIPAAVVIIGVAYGDAVVEQLHRTAQGIYEEGDQGAIRLASWRYGIEAISRSPLVGFGPGAYSGGSGPFQDFEAHNSLIDWGMSTGLLGVVLHLMLWGWCIYRTLKFDSPVLFGMMVALIVFVTFGYLLRHPAYWIVLLLVLTLSERPQARVRDAASPPLGGGSSRRGAIQPALLSGSPRKD